MRDAIPFLDLGAQYETIRADVDAAIADVIRQSAFVGGPHVRAFEEAFARYSGVKHCVGVANGTDALFVALKALGIGPGDEVMTSATSFIATSEAITLAGARPVFVDVDPVTLTIDPERIPERITPRTRAIVPVHLYGHPARMTEILALARRYGLFVVGDAAQAHGARYRGRAVTEMADVSCFSFYPGKNLGAYGDGGALVTSRDEVAAAARVFSDHGRVSRYEHDREGINSRLDGIQAAVLGVKLRHLDVWTDRRRAIAARYTRMLRGISVATPVESADVKAVYHLYVVRVPDGARDGLREALTAHGIQSGVHYPVALPFLEAYRHRGHLVSEYPEAVRASREVLSLPIYPEMTDAQLDRVVGVIGEARSLSDAADSVAVR